MCTEKKPHKHAALIKAWADGATIQIRNTGHNWIDVIGNRPHWDENTEYRIKPELIVLYYTLFSDGILYRSANKGFPANRVKAVFDPITHELLSVEKI